MTRNKPTWLHLTQSTDTMMFKTEKFLIIALMFLTFALIKADKKDKDSRKEGLRWFNASVQEDCNEIPEQLEVKIGIQRLF